LIQILAPNDDAFTSFLRALGGGRKLPKEDLYKLPELKDILQYHIIPGRYLTGGLPSNELSLGVCHAQCAVY
jgi:uncharacterized surface protein with fasciclin (FAS1) repeats